MLIATKNETRCLTYHIPNILDKIQVETSGRPLSWLITTSSENSVANLLMCGSVLPSIITKLSQTWSHMIKKFFFNVCCMLVGKFWVKCSLLVIRPVAVLKRLLLTCTSRASVRRLKSSDFTNDQGSGTQHQKNGLVDLSQSVNCNMFFGQKIPKIYAT